MKITDEILNKLIDNELNKKEIEELHDLIKRDDFALGKVKAHQMVDSILKKIDVESAPEDTTEKIMERISNSVLVADKKNGFLKFIISSFALLSFLTIAFVLFVSSTSEVNESSTKYSNFIDKFVSFFTSLNISINDNVMIVIGGVLMILFFVSGYFMLEERKSFKQKLENYF